MENEYKHKNSKSNMIKLARTCPDRMQGLCWSCDFAACILLHLFLKGQCVKKTIGQGGNWYQGEYFNENTMDKVRYEQFCGCYKCDKYKILLFCWIQINAKTICPDIFTEIKFG